MQEARATARASCIYGGGGKATDQVGPLYPFHGRRVPHISLVFREMWDTTNLNNSAYEAENFRVGRRGIPHLAKNERDVGHPAFVAGVAEAAGSA